MESINDDDIEGFEYQLTAIQEYIDNFSENDAMGNFAASQNYPTDKSLAAHFNVVLQKKKDS
jgi:hypothetical protein